MLTQTLYTSLEPFGHRNVIILLLHNAIGGGMRYLPLVAVIATLLSACGGINRTSEDNPLSAAPVASSPAPPVAKPAAKRPDKGRITLSWDAVAGASWYNLYYGTKPGVTRYGSMKITKICTTTHTVTGLLPDTVYFFVVTAANAETESSESSEVCGKPTTDKPEAKEP